MAKGILYVMTTSVKGLVKIGKTNNFEERMGKLESDGYKNVNCLKREFAIEVEDYDEKEHLLDNIFQKSRVNESELFALDVEIVKQLMSSMEGKVIYPKNESKKQIFEQAVEISEINEANLPEGTYFLEHKINRGKTLKAKLKVTSSGELFLEKGADFGDEDKLQVASWSELKKQLLMDGDTLMKDLPCDSLSMASSLVIGSQSNGWREWKDADGNRVDKYRRRSISND